MVTKYGMSSVLGPTSIAYEDNGRSLSSETRAAVEQEVRLRPCLLLDLISILSSRSFLAALPSGACSCSSTGQDAWLTSASSTGQADVQLPMGVGLLHVCEGVLSGMFSLPRFFV